MDYKPQYSDIVCGPLANPELHHALHSMPRLSTVVVHSVYSHEFRHGITWETMCSLHSLPSLSRLALGRIWICPITPDAAALKLNPSSPLTCFEYALPGVRNPHSDTPEVDALERILRFLHPSLEKLSLPTEPAPMQTIRLLDWPCMRELRLRGTRWTTPDIPAVSLFARMSNLRVLVLELEGQEGVPSTALWPRGFPASYPWPYLESLSVTYPDLDDEIYEHLPPTMLSLTLRPWPHECIRRWQDVNHRPEKLRPYRPSPFPSVLLAILSRCVAPRLRDLGIEYYVDSAEMSLLSHIVASFPCLTTFELHRHRHQRDADIPVVSRRPVCLASSRLKTDCTPA